MWMIDTFSCIEGQPTMVSVPATRGQTRLIYNHMTGIDAALRYIAELAHSKRSHLVDTLVVRDFCLYCVLTEQMNYGSNTTRFLMKRIKRFGWLDGINLVYDQNFDFRKECKYAKWTRSEVTRFTRNDYERERTSTRAKISPSLRP